MPIPVAVYVVYILVFVVLFLVNIVSYEILDRDIIKSSTAMFIVFIIFLLILDVLYAGFGGAI